MDYPLEHGVTSFYRRQHKATEWADADLQVCRSELQPQDDVILFQDTRIRVRLNRQC
ncbi:hypothetical protein WL1483_576 [Aeromonas schubertii]|uniref:Uncharacterized protein n=1 Tax=Aeromonas schubertii TaxID=652 RepID=A0A0S2SE56_9GAMM|nr:hypothetical protein WL1483_576 [Aeromonas schubertii]